MNVEDAIEQFNKAAKNAAPVGGSIKFLIDETAIYIDGTGEENVVSADDKDADTTITTSLENLLKLRSGDLNPMMAVMSGKVKISGDMGLAMKLQSLLG
jgi:putative sterol carrier protein